PIRHRNMLFNDSGKIMKYFGELEDSTTPRNRIHKVFDIFYCDNRLYIFYEVLGHCRSIHHLYSDASGVVLQRQPPNGKLRRWMTQLAETIDFMSHHAIAHRYIRAEYVLVDGHGSIKLTHFDLAC